MAWSFDGKVLASGGADKRIILWNAKNGVRLTELKGHSAEINGVRFSLDGTMLASCSGFCFDSDNSVRLWDVGQGKNCG